MFNLHKWKYIFNCSKFKRFLWTVKTEDDIICINDPQKLEELKFPLIWLRDNCQCSQCFHAMSNSRTIDAEKFNFNIQPSLTVVSYETFNYH